MTTEWVLYLRKSVGRAGISRQRTTTTAHIQRLGGSILAEFPDTDRTAFQKTGGARPVRERFDDMIAFLRAHPGVGVAAWHADRLTRNDDDTRTLMSLCATGGHLIETPRGGTYDVSTATGRKRLRDDASDAIFEVDHLTERVVAAKMEAVAAGEDLGGRRRFGWRARKDGFGIITAEAELIATGTRAIVAGVSLASVTRAWNASGVTTTTGNAWTAVEVRRTLRRARNAGLLEHHGKVTGPGTNWEPIVTEAEWRACCAVLGNPARRDTPGPARRWLLSGIAECGVCQSRVIVTMSAGNGRVSRPVYRDRPRGTSRGHVARAVDAVDGHVEVAVKGILERKEWTGALLPRASDLALLDAEIKTLEGELEQLAEDAGQRKITARQLAIASAPLQAELETLKQRFSVAVQPDPLTAFVGRDVDAVWEDSDLDQRRAVIKRLGMRIIIKPAPRGRVAGWRPGESYFDPRSVEITPIELSP